MNTRQRANQGMLEVRCCTLFRVGCDLKRFRGRGRRERKFRYSINSKIAARLRLAGIWVRGLVFLVLGFGFGVWDLAVGVGVCRLRWALVLLRSKRIKSPRS